MISNKNHSFLSYRKKRAATGASVASGGRRGFTMVELTGTCLLMGVVFSMTIPMLLVVARERRSTEQRQFALQHASNLLEKISQRETSELVEGEALLPEVDEELLQILPGLEQKLLIKSTEEDNGLQLITSIRWRNGAGQMVAPLRLSAWVYRTKEVHQ